MKKIAIKNIFHSFIINNDIIYVLNNINLIIEKGDFVVILGKSGCGKTTILNILAGLISPTSGSVLIDNNVVKEPHYSRPFIFQNPCLLPWLNVKENISFGCKIRGDKKNLNCRIKKYIQLMQLENFEKVYPSQLSLGMAQRVAFARALINNPDVLFLDEPFAALDFLNRKRLQSELIKNWLFEKYTIIFVTHDIEEAVLIGKKIIILGNKPSSIIHNIEIDLKYPRDLSNEKLFNLKLKIQKYIEAS